MYKRNTNATVQFDGGVDVGNLYSFLPVGHSSTLIERKVICYQLESVTLMTTGAFSRNVDKLFSELKLVT